MCFYKPLTPIYLLMTERYFKILFALLLVSSFVTAQVIVDAELRPRFEYRHGF